MTRKLSERTRAFYALMGVVFPRVGDRGVFYQSGTMDAEFEDDWTRAVEVTDVSETGKTICTRFVHPEGQERHGHLRQQWLYRNNFCYYWGRIGEVRFR